MMDKIISGMLIVIGIINLLPAMVFFDISKTLKLYGVTIEGESMAVLMRHRGVLLALVGIALIAAALKPEYRLLAITLALISKVAFIFLTFTTAGHSAEVRQVALIDVGAIVLLLVVLGMHFYGK